MTPITIPAFAAEFLTPGGVLLLPIELNIIARSDGSTNVAIVRYAIIPHMSPAILKPLVALTVL